MGISAVSDSLLFKTPEFNRQLLRTIGKASLGGADIGECFATAFQIKGCDFERWYTQWNTLANRIFNDAQSSENKGYYVSALSGYLRATEYYRQAEFFLREHLDDPRIIESADRISESFRKAIPFLPYYVIPVEIPFEGNTFLHGYYCQFALEKHPKATIIMPGKYDSYCEEMYFSAVEFLKRNYNVLIIDGPGQGQTLRRNKLYMRPDWENVIKPIIDYAKHLPFTRAEQFVLLGRSFGGYLAARAAAGDHEFSALICDPGTWDLFTVVQQKFPKEIEAILANKDPSDPIMRFYFQTRMAAHNASSPSEWISMAQQYSLKDYAKNIRCPALICYASEDKSQEQAQLLANGIGPSAQLLEFNTMEGAGDHCEAGAPQLFAQRVGDWLDSMFA